METGKVEICRCVFRALSIAVVLNPVAPSTEMLRGLSHVVWLCPVCHSEGSFRSSLKAKHLALARRLMSKKHDHAAFHPNHSDRAHR